MAREGRRRAALLYLGLLAGLVGLGVRLTVVQGLDAGRYGTIAAQQRLRTILLPSTRGAIYDRHGRELALSLPARTIYANPKQISDPDGVARSLEPLLGLERRELIEKLSRPKGFVYLSRRVDVEVAGRIAGLGLPGVGIIDEARRDYPAGTLAANVLGFVGGEARGLAGTELAYERLLGGKPGQRVLEQDPAGRAIPQGRFSETPPEAGADLVLTLDREIQHAADTALAKAVDDTGAKGGTVVVMRPDTGDILAMANHPTFDPNAIGRFDLEQARNRALTDIYEPGSANKVVTAAAALEEGVVSPGTAFPVPAALRYGGRTYNDAHGHATKTMTFEEIIADSSNVGTIKVAIMLGPDRLTEYLKRFGYGRRTGLGFPGEQAGLVPRADRWKSSLPTMAIGQGLSVTALQIVRVFGTIANDGVQVEPRLVAGWVDADGTLHRTDEGHPRRVIGEATARTLRGMLEKVVVDGTGTLAAIPGFRAAGKTGTAQKPAPQGGYQGYMASFMGFVPADDPRLVIGVVLDDPSPIWGGVVAAPVFRDVGAAALRVLRVAPTEPVEARPDPKPERAARDNDAAAVTTSAPKASAKPAPKASASPSPRGRATPSPTPAGATLSER